MTIPEGHKFGAVALTQTRSHLRNPCRLSEDLIIYPESPFTLDEFWTKTQGTARAKQVAESNLVIVSHAAKSTPDDWGHENIEIAHRFYGALQLVAVPVYDTALKFAGIHQGGQFDIREFGHLDDLYHPYDTKDIENFVFINETHIKDAHDVLPGLNIMDPKNDSHWRFRQGLNAYWKAVYERNGYYRLPQLVRALEAILKLRVNRSTADFTHRMQTFLKPRTNLADELSLIYKLRSRLLHIQPVEELFPNIERRDVWPTIEKLTRRIELVTRDLLRYILVNDDIRKIFETDDLIETFWQLRDDERIAIWKTRLVL